MVELYVSWCKGLAQDKQALAMLKNCQIITGIETLNSKGEREPFQQAGLKVSIHNMIKLFHCCLSDKNLISEFKKKENTHTLDNIRKSDAKAVGFHAYYKTQLIENHVRHGKPLPEGIFENESLEQIRERIVKNLVFLERNINKGLKKQKKVLFETQPFMDFTKLKNPVNKVSDQEMKLMKRAGMMCTPDFISSVLNDKRIKNNKNIGFLFDIAHVFISVKTRFERKELNDEIESYMKKIIGACKGKVYQMHIACPVEIARGCFVDDQVELKKGDILSDHMLSIARQILKANPDIKSITLEIDTYLEPVPHAKKMIQQAKMVAKELNLKVEK